MLFRGAIFLYRAFSDVTWFESSDIISYSRALSNLVISLKFPLSSPQQEPKGINTRRHFVPFSGQLAFTGLKYSVEIHSVQPACWSAFIPPRFFSNSLDAHLLFTQSSLKHMKTANKFGWKMKKFPSNYCSQARGCTFDEILIGNRRVK